MKATLISAAILTFTAVNGNIIGEQWASVDKPGSVVCPIDDNGDVAGSWADHTWEGRKGGWSLPKDQGMTELFKGDYAFVVSAYYGACATDRARHDGGGFIGTLNQETEMIMCCTGDDGFGGDVNLIPTVLKGRGTFKEYGTFDDPRGAYFGTCSKATLAKGDYKVCCDDHWSSGVFIKATNAGRKVACTEPTTVTTTTKTTTTRTKTTTTLTSTTNTIVAVLKGQLTETQQLLENQIQATDKHVAGLQATIEAMGVAHLKKIESVTTQLEAVKQQFATDLADIQEAMLGKKGVDVGTALEMNPRQQKCGPFDESAAPGTCTPTIEADGSIAMTACCGEIVLHSEQCSVNPCDTQTELNLLKDLLSDVLGN